MKLLDLYCCAGGAAKGYADAGFDIVGVDINPQPNYPYKFIQADAIEYLTAHGKEFDLIHAYPPCQKYSKIQNLAKARNQGGYGEHPDLIAPTRKALVANGKPYIIENVVGAPLINPFSLSGSQFGLKTQRQRNFETSFEVDLSELPLKFKMKTPAAGNGVGVDGSISICGSGGVRGLNSKTILTTWSTALGGVDWMTRQEMAECIPPAYTKFIGEAFKNATP
jgi:DNA (cytosine-5)-methyltransferase 1